jgi:hypothetical protein
MQQNDLACCTSRRESQPGPLDKRAVIQGLHVMMVARLFGDRPWLADRESCEALNNKLYEFGLQEDVLWETNMTKTTTLGKELNFGLVLVFIGLLNEWDLVMTLEDHDLIDEFEATCICDQLETCSDPEHVLRPIVQKAFHKHFNPSGLLV